VLLIVSITILPLLILGWGAMQVSVERLTQKVADSQSRSSDQLASEIELLLELQASLIADQVDAFNLSRLDDRKLTGFQRLAFQQLSDVNIVSVVNGEGRELVPSLFLEAPSTGALSTKDVVEIQRLTEFREALPVGRMEKERSRWLANPSASRPTIVGRPYLPEGRAAPVLPVVVPADAATPLYFAVELSLDRIDARFRRAADAGLSVMLLDGGGAVALERGPALIEPDRFRVFMPSTAATEVQYTSSEGDEVFGACAPVPGTGWLVVVAEPFSVISDAGAEIFARTSYISGVAAVLSILLGLLVSGGIAERVTRVRDAALSVAEGELGRTVSLEGASEIRDLSRAFNFMSRRLASNQSRIADQQSEIAEFNEELQRQLEAQERRLTEAHRVLLQSGRLAAVGEMGAGLAHELNNPLAGILGMVQILQMNSPDDKLAEIEAQARRCSAIVAELLRFSRPQGRDAPRIEREDWTLVDLREVIADVVGLVRGPLVSGGLELECALPSGLMVRGDPEALSGAVIQLLNSLRGACGSTGSLGVSGGVVDSTIEVEFRLNSAKIDGQSDDWKASGMGFWLARQVLAEHSGNLREPKMTPGATSATWVLRLPVG